MVFRQRGLAGSTFIAERFFRPRGSQPVSLERGFLADPDGFLGGMLAGDVCRRTEIHPTQCSILLGEPGMGKSTAMEQRREEVRPESFFDLRTCASEEVLLAVRNSCSSGDSSAAHIVIDSVDEADMPNFAARLVGELRRLPPGVLRLELACRASEWPEMLETALPEVFAGSAVSYFQMQPLRHVDAAAIVEAVGIDQKAFLKALFERDLGALAGVPLTLELLIKAFGNDHSFPQRTTEIYEKALLQLCDERSLTRRQQRRGRLASTRRLEIAGHLAAATVLGNRPRLVERSPLLARDGELAIVGLVPFIEGADEAEVSEVLSTGLFVHSGVDTSAFYHHSFGEFLAARWLHSSGFSRQQLRQLLFHHEGPEHLVPQMSGVATWLACLSSEMARLLAELAPENFIEADSPLATDAHRASAVEALMNRAKTQSLTRYWWPEVASKRLGHSGLAEQLRPYVMGSELDPFVRRKATYIARANGLVELLDDLASIVLDESTSEGVRVEAVEAAFGCTRNPALLAQRILYLVEPDSVGTIGDDLRAAVLEELWPKHIDAVQLFRYLTPPRRGPVRGSYSSFILRVASHLGPADLVTALEWAGLAARRHGQNSMEFEGLAAAIFLAAWPHLDDPACREAFARAAWRTLKLHRPVLVGPTQRKEAEALLADTARRRLLLGELARLSETPDDAYCLAHPQEQPPFATEADIEWILGERSRAFELERTFWEVLVRRLLPWRPNFQIIELILGEIGDAPATAMLPFPLSVDLNSGEAVRAAQRHRQEVAWKAEAAQVEEEARASRTRAIEPWLEKAQQGDHVGWCQAVARMRQHRERGGERELLAAFAEEDDTAEDRATYLRLAKWYLEQAPTDPATWLSEKGTTWYPVIAAYMSVRLVSQLDTDWWSEHASTALARWAGAIVGFDVHVLREQADLDAHRALVHGVFLSSPDEGRRVVGLLLEREAADQPDLAFLSYLPPGTPVGDLLERALLTNSKRLEGFQTIFEKLAKFDLPRAIAFARCSLSLGNSLLRPLRPPLVSCGRWRSRCEGRRPRLGDARRHSVHQFVMVLVLLGVETLEAWLLVRSAGRRYPQLARAVANMFADDFHPNWGKHLPDEDLAELYRWLPDIPATEKTSDSIVPLRVFRQNLLSQLASRGSTLAVEALTALEDATSNDSAVQRAAAEGRQRYRELSWQPVRPELLFEMRRATNRRMVQSSEHLLDVVLEAIDAYAEHVQGKPPAVEDLWNATPARKGVDVEYWPKDEGALSNHLKRYLKAALTGVLVNREVEITPTSVEPQTGERVDLLVQTLCPQTLQQWTVVIEVKGSWNSQLQTHLDKQLRERYLGSAEFKCGVYLVGWYACSKWAIDSRREATRRLDRAQVEKRLGERARVASSGGRTVCLRILDLSMGRVPGPDPGGA